MGNIIKIGAMIEAPVACLNVKYKELLNTLTVANPAYTTAMAYGYGKVSDKIPKKLFFFTTNEATKTILFPRGTSKDYFNGLFEYSGIAEGREISEGVNAGFKLRAGQQEFFDSSIIPYINNIYNNNNTHQNIDLLINAECGSGKCHGKGTEVLMFDGSLKKVEDVQIGDLLMGDDSTPRKVLSLAKGKEEMFKVVQRDGEDYIVNRSHILSLQKREWGAGSGSSRSIKSKDEYGKIVNISVDDYLKLPKTKQNWLYGYSKPVHYPAQYVPLDPYFIGAWLGDGSSRTSMITTYSRDIELIDYYYSLAREYKLKVRVEKNSNNSNNYHINTGKKGGLNLLVKMLRHFDLLQNKHIPNNYLINSKKNRLELLAGLVDTDGYLDGKSIEITQKSKQITDGLLRLCWSLGYKTQTKEKIVKGTIYYRTTIKGNNLSEIPTRLPRKKIIDRACNKDASISSFTVESLGMGDYYGFTLDGNHLYHLKDSTITHNTIMSLYLASIYQRSTIVVVTRKKIGEQFIAEAKKHFKGWTVGWENEKDTFDITISTYALLSSERFDATYFSKFGHIVLDEYHRCGADTYSEILKKATCKYRTSMTATFRRKDGLHKILKLHAGDILEMERASGKAKIFPLATGADVNEYLFRGIGRFPLSKDKLEVYRDIAVRVKSADKKLRRELDRGMVLDTVRDSNKKLVSFTLMSGITQKQQEFKASETNLFALGQVSTPMIDTAISENDFRNDIALQIIRECYRAGRRIIVLSKRKEQLFRMASRLRRYGIDNAIVVSEQDKDYRAYCEKNGRTVTENADYAFKQSRVILGIDKIAEEGMDAPEFDTLLYMHLIKDIEQSIGRILRESPTKKKPLGICLVDKITMYQNAFYSPKAGSKKMFEELGHTVMEGVELSELLNNIKTDMI